MAKVDSSNIGQTHVSNISCDNACGNTQTISHMLFILVPKFGVQYDHKRQRYQDKLQC